MSVLWDKIMIVNFDIKLIFFMFLDYGLKKLLLGEFVLIKFIIEIE